jgi:hypothetical protein
MFCQINTLKPAVYLNNVSDSNVSPSVTIPALSLTFFKLIRKIRSLDFNTRRAVATRIMYNHKIFKPQGSSVNCFQ